MQRVGFYADSFYPLFTEAHLHLVKTASILFDRVIIGICFSPEKTRRYSRGKMKTAIEKIIKRENLNNVTVICYTGLLADVAKTYHATVLIRGLSNGMNYDSEEMTATANEKISGLDTVYLRFGKFSFINSNILLKYFDNGKDVSEFVPKEILDILG